MDVMINDEWWMMAVVVLSKSFSTDIKIDV